MCSLEIKEERKRQGQLEKRGGRGREDGMMVKRRKRKRKGGKIKSVKREKEKRKRKRWEEEERRRKEIKGERDKQWREMEEK